MNPVIEDLAIETITSLLSNSNSYFTLVIGATLTLNYVQFTQLKESKRYEEKHKNILIRILPIIEKVINKEKLSYTDRINLEEVYKYIQDNCI